MSVEAANLTLHSKALTSVAIDAEIAVILLIRHIWRNPHTTPRTNTMARGVKLAICGRRETMTVNKASHPRHPDDEHTNSHVVTNL